MTRLRSRVLPLLSMLFVLACGYLVLAVSQTGEAGQEESAGQTLWAPYWSVGPGFTSTLEMKNNRMEETVRVWPSLYFASGEEYYLDPIYLGPRQTVVININQVIESLPPATRARAGKEGTAEVEFNASNVSAVMGSISVINPEQGTAWNFRLYPTYPGLPRVPVRGLFWFPDSSTDGFVAAQNVSEEFMSVTPHFHIASAVHSLPPVSLAPGQGYKLELRKGLNKLGLGDVSAGGIEFTYDGGPDGLRAHGVLFNQHGFSAEIDFHRFDTAVEEVPFALRTPRFAIGPADPRLGLPAQTSFEPTLALHNFGPGELSVTLSVGYRMGEGGQEMQFPVALAPQETRVIAPGEQLEGVVPLGVHWASLEVSYASQRNQLAAALVSVSQDGEHSLVSVLNPVHGNVSDGWYWQAGVDSTTLIGILNTDSEEAIVAVSFDYYIEGQRQSYELPEITIPARVSELIDVGAIIAAGQPDKDGDVIPRGVSYGGYQVRKVGGRQDTTAVTEALVINRRTKSYLTLYNTCCAYVGVTLSPSSVTGVPGDSRQMDVWATNTCTNFLENLTFAWQTSYSSSNSGVASISGSGLVSLVAPGNTSVRAQVRFYRDPIFCLDPFKCPCELGFASDSSSVTVNCGDVRDQIRDEYRVRSIPVPACGEFTQTKSSAHFSFSEMNGGDYSWAIIRDRLLSRLEQTRVNVGNKPIDVISGYRNPVRNASVVGRTLSRHQYGDAADSCPRDYNGDGVVDKADQAILETEGKLAGFNEVVLEPLTCVHLGSL